MEILTGTIETKETKKSPGDFTKEVIFLKMDDGESASIEFRSVSVRETLKQFDAGVKVAIAVRREAKKSKSSGIVYNNIIAQTIKQL